MRGGNLRYQLSFTIGLVLFLIYSILIFLVSTTFIAYIFVIFSLIVFFIGILLVNSHTSGGTEPKNRFKFIAILLPFIPIVLSRGYIGSHLTALYAFNNADTVFIALIFPIAEFSVIMLSNFESASFIGKRSSMGGYDIEDMENELGRFTKTIFLIALAAFILGYLSYIAILILPVFNIGLIPAIIVFFAVYAILMRNTIKKTEQQ